MTYTIAAMAKLSGLSTRALRHYDKFGLLSPERMQENRYRLYDEEDVDRLQQILFTGSWASRWQRSNAFSPPRIMMRCPRWKAI